MARIQMFKTGESRSFPNEVPFVSGTDRADIALVLGPNPGSALAGLDYSAYRAVVVELGNVCLGVFTGEDFGREGGNVMGFARHRNGREAPTDLVELVVQPGTETAARSAAIALFRDAGLAVAVCNDTPGRIVESLMRPYLNQALSAIDRGLAVAADLDRALKLGLRHPRGPVEVLSGGGLAQHYEATAALYCSLGGSEYLPPRRAQVAALRATPTEGEVGS